VIDSSISKKQWVSWLGVWGLKKNIASNEMSNIVRIQRKRKADDSKDTHFIVQGRVVAQENIDRWEKRQQNLDGSGSDGSSLMEIDRADMYSSSSSDSSITVIKEEEFDAAVRGFELAVLTQPTSGREEANCRLRAAARSGNVWLVQHLLNSGADVESFSESGTTALHAAAFYGHVAVADLLIKAGADVEASKTGDEVQVSYTVADMREVHCVRRPRLIHLATSRNHVDIVSLLLDNNARVDSVERLTEERRAREQRKCSCKVT